MLYMLRDSELLIFENMSCRWFIGEEVFQSCWHDSKGHFEWDLVEQRRLGGFPTKT